MHDEIKVLLLLTDVDINLLCFLILDIYDLKNVISTFTKRLYVS